MNIEEMQAVWSDMTRQLEKQKKLTNEIIMKMTVQQYKNRLNKIAYPEKIGAVVCYAIVLYILINIGRLNDTISLVSGIITMLILSILPILSLSALRKIQTINIVANNYKQTLTEYTKRKKWFQFVQQLGIGLGFLLMFVMLPATSKLINGKNLDFFEKWKTWIWLFPLMIIYFIIIARWVYSCYSRNIKAAEEALRELDENQ